MPYPPLEVGVVDAEGRRDVGWFVSSGNGQAGPFDDPGVQDTTDAALIRQNAVWERELHRALPLLLGRAPWEAVR